MLRTATALAAFCLSLAALSLIGRASATALQAGAPNSLTAAIATTTAARAPYAFDVDVDSSKISWRMHFNPQGTPHVQLLSPPRASLSHEQEQAFVQSSQNLDGLSWCASTLMGHVTNVQLIREDASTATYSFQPTQESIRNPQIRRFAPQLRGEFTLTKANPDITRMHIYAPASFSPMVLTQISRMDVVMTCAPAPNARMFIAQQTSHIAGSAMGQAFDEQTIQRVHGVAAP